MKKLWKLLVTIWNKLLAHLEQVSMKRNQTILEEITKRGNV